MTKTTDRPLVTFALFAYNQEQYIREAIEGAFTQTYEPLEIILSDDCSTDRTFGIMKEMAAAYKGPHDVKVRQNVSNEGLAQHINNVHEVSHGEYMTWSAGDDVALPNRTSRFIAELQDGSNLVHSALIEIDVDSNAAGIRQHNESVRSPSLESVIRSKQGVVTQSFCFRREVFDKFGSFLPELTHEAIAFGFRAAWLGRVKYISEPLTKYRIGSGISTQAPSASKSKHYSEAIKVSQWRMTALRQISCDLSSLGNLNPLSLRNLVESELRKWSIIYSINTGQYNYFILADWKRHFLDRDVIRALARRHMPGILYMLYKKSAAEK